MPLRLALLALACLTALPATAQDIPTSRYGIWDRQGANSLMSEETGVRAANTIRRGRIFSIGRDYTADMPMQPGRGLSAETRTETRGGATLAITRLEGALGHVGTRLTGPGTLGTAGAEPTFYNGLTGAARAELGAEQLKPFFTRGILIDMVSVRGEAMAAGEEITVADIEKWLEWKGLKEPGKGDAVLFHTGWGRHWRADNATYLSGAPGIGEDVAGWLLERGVALVGADTWAVVVQKDEAAPDLALQVEMVAKHGLYLHENLETARIIDAEITEFAYIYAPLAVPGAASAIGTPLIAY